MINTLTVEELPSVTPKRKDISYGGLRLLVTEIYVMSLHLQPNGILFKKCHITYIRLISDHRFLDRNHSMTETSLKSEDTMELVKLDRHGVFYLYYNGYSNPTTRLIYFIVYFL